MSCGSTNCSTTLPINFSLDDFGAKAFALSRPRPVPSWASVLQNLRWLAQLYARRRQRLALLELNDWLLRDIGLTREQAEEEARKSLWM